MGNELLKNKNEGYHDKEEEYKRHQEKELEKFKNELLKSKEEYKLRLENELEKNKNELLKSKELNKRRQREMDRYYKYFVYMVRVYDNKGITFDSELIKNLDSIAKLNNYDYMNLRSGDYRRWKLFNNF
jgi:ATP-dependent 26S proteasome regulatory subunit